MPHAWRAAMIPALIAACFALAACSSNRSSEDPNFRTGDIEPGGLNLGGLLPGGGGSRYAGPGPGIGVNSFLWRATLDTIDFMPLESADPYGGVVLTDWYANPEAPSERFKATVYILDSRLRADGLKVNVFRQVYDETGGRGWVDAPASADTAIQIENAILTRARQLKIATLDK